MEQSEINEGLLAIEEPYSEYGVDFNASFENNMFVLEAFVKDSPENLALHTSIFFDAPAYFPLQANCYYKFLMHTFQDVEAPVAKASNSIVIETSMAAMPDTGGVTQSQWNAFTEQLIYTINGEPATLPVPDFLPTQE